MPLVSTGYRPHKFQQILHAERRRFSVFPMHRRFGKTVFSVNTLIDAALRCKLHKPRFAYVAPFRLQAKEIAWDMFKTYSMMIPGVEFNESELKIKLPHNGAVISLYGADRPDGLRGIYLDGLVVDEVAQIKPDVWTAVLRPTLADREGWALFVGTPKGLDLFYELYQRAKADPNWAAKSFNAEETNLPWLQPSELADARNEMSEALYQQEFMCDFGASVENALIPISLMQAAINKFIKKEDFSFAAKVLGVDVARFGDDASVIAFRQGLNTWEPIVVKGLDNMELADLVANHINRFKPDMVFVDAGQGQGVIDRLRQLGHENIAEIPFGGKPSDLRFLNKRSEIWYLMMEWLKAGGVLTDTDLLKADLTAPTYDYDNKGKICLERKKDTKKRLLRSVDCGDALAVTFAFPVEPKNPDFNLAVEQALINEGAAMKYDIFS